MTKTAKEIIRHHLKRVYFNGSTDTVARQNVVIPNDTKLGETQIEVELDQALKELEAIMSRQVIGYTQYPDRGKDVTYDMFIESTLQAKQRRRLRTALYGREAEL